jgi:hypothetical protein
MVATRADATKGDPTAAPPAAAAAADRLVTLCQVSAAGTETTRVRPVKQAKALLAGTRSYAGPCVAYGTPDQLGNGTVRTYVQRQDSRPLAVGAVFPESALTGLEQEPSDGERCYDVNADGAIDPMMECAGGWEHPLDLPRQSDVPLKWSLVNWNPHGHGAPGVYTYPHFDFHFYLQPKAERDAIRPGPCGVIVHCDDYQTGIVPVPAEYFPPGYTDIGAVEVKMGNHLVNMSGPEWQGQPFMKTMIFGSYAGKITFIEPMVSLAYFQQVRSGQTPGGCAPINQPKRWQEAGWYPQDYCIRYRANRGDFTVSLENFKRG